ncbi:hypothetical protein, partial [Deinococcus wulumuqiensis]
MKLPIPATPEEIAPIAAQYGILEEQKRSLFLSDTVAAGNHIEALNHLRAGDIQSYLEFWGESKGEEWKWKEEIKDIAEQKPWGIEKLILLVFDNSFSLYNLYYRSLLFRWLSREAEVVEEGTIEFAASKGIEFEELPEQIFVSREHSIRQQFLEINLLEDRLFQKFRYYNHYPSQTRWILPIEIPEWVRFLLGLPILEEAKIDYPAHLQPTLTAQPYILVDRATRDGRNWTYSPDFNLFPFFEGKGMTLSYDPRPNSSGDIQAAATLAIEEISKLDDRTADVWRVILWKAMENGPADGNVYKRIRIDAREVAQLMGYKKHHKGGMKPEHVLEVQEALQHIENMRLYIDASTKGTLEKDTGQAKGKRKLKAVQKAREEKLVSVMAREVERDLFGKTYHMIWEIALGDWAQYFPLSYAPMVKALVALPAKAKWAKRLGTELMLHYREDARCGSKVKKLKWSTLLDRAGLLKEVEEMRASRNTARVRKYAEAALDQLREIAVLEKWQMKETHLSQVNDGDGKPGNFDRWLESVVEIHAPHEVLELLDTIKRPDSKKEKAKRTPPSK